MKIRSILLFVVLLTTTTVAAVCQDGAAPERPGGADAAVYADAARRAWAFIERNYQPETGLVRAHEEYPYVTTWDIGSGLIALYSAHELGLLPADEYDRRIRRALRTLREMPLYEGVAFNRAYSAETARMVDRDDQPSERGTGWSAVDIGRLLSVLKVIESNHPRYAGEIAAVVRRLDVDRIIRNGYLWGEDVGPGGEVRSYPEGRIGYEQYAAQGFALWGLRAENALDVSRNTGPVTVLGTPLLADRRGEDRLTSEPFFLMGLEQDLWGEELGELARGVLAAQEARYRETGEVTMVSEDALPDPPHYFYYYNVYHDGREFAVDAQGPMEGVRAPRWVSTKAAFAWNALFPSDYTRLAVQAVREAHHGEPHWRAGIYEGTDRLAGPGNVNTSAVILESALFHRLGHRLFRERSAAAGGA